ncbi:hypothetical protein ACFX14_034164 [Malus domestica]
MGPQRRLGIYVGFDSPSIIRYLELLTGDIFTARFADCHFDKTVFPSLGGQNTIPEERQKLTWDVPTLSHFDPRSTQCENEVKRIIHLQSIANNMLDAFNDASKVTKSHIPTANAPVRMDVPIGQNKVVANESSGARLKRGRPPGLRDSAPRKRKTKAQLNPNEVIKEEKIIDKSPIHDSEKENIIDETHVPEETEVHESKEISINYACINELWDRNEIIIDDMFTFSVASEIILSDDIEPCSVERKIIFLPFSGTIYYTFICHFSLKLNLFLDFSLVFL